MCAAAVQKMSVKAVHLHCAIHLLLGGCGECRTVGPRRHGVYTEYEDNGRVKRNLQAIYNVSDEGNKLKCV